MLRGDATVAVVKATEDGRRDDATHALDRPRYRGVAVEGLVPAGRVVVLVDEGAEHSQQMALAERVMWSTHSRRRVPFTRSTNGFCHGDFLELTTSVMPSALTFLRNTSPQIASRSHWRNRGSVQQGNASTICCAAHSAVGCRVTLMWTMRRRS